MELVTSGDEKLAFCGVDLLEVGTAHPCPRLVGIGVTASCKGDQRRHTMGTKGGKNDLLVHYLVRKHESNHGDKILRTPGRIYTIEEARMGVVVTWGVAGLLKFSEIMEREDNDGGGELGHGDDASKPLDKVVCRLELALEVCWVEMVGGMGEPQPADHLSVGACNILEEILYALRSVLCCAGRVGEGGMERGGKWGKVCVGGNGFVIVVLDHIVVDPILLITATVRDLIVVVFLELVVFRGELWLWVVPNGSGSG